MVILPACTFVYKETQIASNCLCYSQSLRQIIWMGSFNTLNVVKLPMIRKLSHKRQYLSNVTKGFIFFFLLGSSSSFLLTTQIRCVSHIGTASSSHNLYTLLCGSTRINKLESRGGFRGRGPGGPCPTCI